PDAISGFLLRGCSVRGENALEHLGQHVDTTRVWAHPEPCDHDDVCVACQCGKNATEGLVCLLVGVRERSCELITLRLTDVKLRHVPEHVTELVRREEAHTREVEAFATQEIDSEVGDPSGRGEHRLAHPVKRTGRT